MDGIGSPSDTSSRINFYMKALMWRLREAIVSIKPLRIQNGKLTPLRASC